MFTSSFYVDLMLNLKKKEKQRECTAVVSRHSRKCCVRRFSFFVTGVALVAEMMSFDLIISSIFRLQTAEGVQCYVCSWSPADSGE